MRVAEGGFSGLEAPKIFGLRFEDESHHKNGTERRYGCMFEREPMSRSGSATCVCVCGDTNWSGDGDLRPHLVWIDTIVRRAEPVAVCCSEAFSLHHLNQD